MKLKDAKYKGIWNTLLFYDRWKMMSDMNMSLGKMSDFVLFPLFGFILVIKLRNFESHWNTLIFFNQKSDDLNMSFQTVSDLI